MAERERLRAQSWRARGAALSRKATILVGLVTFLGACSSSRPPAPPPADEQVGRVPVERDYLPPIGLPSRLMLAVSADPPDVALQWLADQLAGKGFEMVTTASAEGRLVLERSGDPEPYIDCGSFVVGGTTPADPGRREAAARFQLRLPVAGSTGEVLLRQLRLDARIVVTASRGQGLTNIEAVTIYGVTRTVDRVAADGRVLDTARETIAFRTDQLGQFAMGLECMATGRLEAEVLSPLTG